MLEVVRPRFPAVNKMFKWTLRVLTLRKVDSKEWTIHDVQGAVGTKCRNKPPANTALICLVSSPVIDGERSGNQAAARESSES
jgi:hypothetical protein